MPGMASTRCQAQKQTMDLPTNLPSPTKNKKVTPQNSISIVENFPALFGDIPAKTSPASSLSPEIKWSHPDILDLLAKLKIQADLSEKSNAILDSLLTNMNNSIKIRKDSDLEFKESIIRIENSSKISTDKLNKTLRASIESNKESSAKLDLVLASMQASQENRVKILEKLLVDTTTAHLDIMNTLGSHDIIAKKTFIAFNKLQTSIPTIVTSISSIDAFTLQSCNIHCQHQFFLSCVTN